MKTTPSTSSDQLLHSLQRAAFDYFERAVNPLNGLVADRAPLGGIADSVPCSIAAVGFALSCYPIAVERGWMRRNEAAKLALTTLRFFCDCEQSQSRAASGYRGFYYHFLHMKDGRRFNDFKHCELSTIDTALLLAGALTAARYFDCDTHLERELRERADTLFARANWHWALNRDEKPRKTQTELSNEHGQSASLEATPRTVSHGWTPERGFLKARWQGYNEALILYILGLASPSFPLPASSYDAWTQTYRWKTIYNLPFLYAGPFFIHQFSHCWIDFKGIQDSYMSTHAGDYFQNSRRATLIQHQYAIRNARFDYNANNWGICAGDGPESLTRNATQAMEKAPHFYGYRARGVPFGADDGTLAPWSTVAALPFAPELVLPFIEQAAARERSPRMSTHARAFDELLLTRNAHFPGGWRADEHFALALGPIVLMIENYRSGLLWELLRGSPLKIGLHRAGFSGGWLAAAPEKQRA